MLQTTIVDSSDELRYVFGEHRATRLIESPELAHRARVGRLYLKAEWERPLGNFKMLGGMLAGLRALARFQGAGSVRALLEDTACRHRLPSPRACRPVRTPRD